MKLLLVLLCTVCIIWQTYAKPKLTKQKLKVVTIESAPFTFLEENNEGNEETKGFLMDLLEELKKKLGFESEVYLVPDGKYGFKDESGNWHGLIGELVNGKADMALAPLTVSKEREMAVKFSIPYMSAGLVPITKRPKPGKQLPFMDVMDIVKNPELKYGCVSQGSTYNFFQTSTHALYKAMGIVLKDNPDLTTETYETGIEKVRNEDGYVFFGEEPGMKFYAGGEPCDLLIIGKTLHERFYALAFPQDQHEMASLFNIALLELNERGTKDTLIDKWWEDDCKKPDYCICQKSVSSEESEESHENVTKMEEEKMRVRRHNDHDDDDDDDGHDRSSHSRNDDDDDDDKKRVRRHNDHDDDSDDRSHSGHKSHSRNDDDDDDKKR